MPTALVTGGATRIGAAIVATLATAGITPAIHANRSIDQARELAKRTGGVVVTGNLLDPGVPETLVGEAAAALQAGVDYFVSNASQFPAQRLADATAKDFADMQTLHAWAPLAITRALASAGGVAAVHILDTRVASHDPAHFAYHASKQTGANLVRSLAKELAPCRVNGVAPGPILPPTDGTTATLEPAIEATALKRAGTPTEVAEAVHYLLQAEYVTGDTLFVDGGRHLMG